MNSSRIDRRQSLPLQSESIEHWIDPPSPPFLASERRSTTILLGGLTRIHDHLIEATWRFLGYRVEALPTTDIDSLHVGKEFCSRGLCNPAYFTVGNLIRYLQRRRDVERVPVDELARRYVFLTPGACGPCRYGTYVTEYRKALRDAGFPGFRVLLFQQQGGVQQAGGANTGLRMTPRFFQQLIKAFLAADVLNLLGYRLRPYEIVPGSTDRALNQAAQICYDALRHGRSMFMALRSCRKFFDDVTVDRLVPKPRVALIGEFWAMTTESAGNYHMQRYLEQEGAEVEVQPLVNWLLYMVWQHEFDTRRRIDLKHPDSGRKGLLGKNPFWKLMTMRLTRWLLKYWFASYAWALGLKDHRLPDMERLATLSHDYYNVELRGGEGHLEVAKLLESVRTREAHMVLSIKPFGCLPSSGVSDGVQSLVTRRFPSALFCPVETTGDAATLAYSRVQMTLFKAKQMASDELDRLVNSTGVSLDEARRRLVEQPKLARWDHQPPHRFAGTAANLYAELVGVR